MQSSVIPLTEPLLLEAYEHAANRNILAALNPRIFFGYFSVCADGVGFGGNATYPGLDWGQSAEALLWLNRADEVKASWNYVRSFQHEDGSLPIAICPDEAGKLLRIFGHPMRVEANGGIYRHWCPGNPLRTLAPVTFLQTAHAIHRHTSDRDWLDGQSPYLRRAVDRLESLTDPSGHVGGAGFYIERPSRIEYDGVNQCATVRALRLAADLFDAVGDASHAAKTRGLSGRITGSFQREFWVENHFAEYIHPERGVISHHGLTDVDWAALACEVATPEQVRILWPKLKHETAFYYGGMPTGIATRPEKYEAWEFPTTDRHDLAAMGRVWYLECQARWRMGDREGILESLRRVATVGKESGWYWRERYHPSREGPIPAGAEKYCEYPANFIRIVHQFLRP